MLNSIYNKEISLDNENNFLINITENKAVGSNKLFGWEEYMLSTCIVKPKQRRR